MASLVESVEPDIVKSVHGDVSHAQAGGSSRAARKLLITRPRALRQHCHHRWRYVQPEYRDPAKNVTPSARHRKPQETDAREPADRR
jgi:hypothetical protein